MSAEKKRIVIKAAENRSPAFFLGQLAAEEVKNAGPEAIATIYSDQADYYLEQAFRRLEEEHINRMDFSHVKFQVGHHDVIELESEDARFKALKELATDVDGKFIVRDANRIAQFLAIRNEIRSRLSDVQHAGDCEMIARLHTCANSFDRPFAALQELRPDALRKIHESYSKAMDYLQKDPALSTHPLLRQENEKAFKNFDKIRMTAVQRLMETRSKKIGELVQWEGGLGNDVREILKEAHIAAQNAAQCMKALESDKGLSAG